jgi:uncharacterized protein
MFFIGAWPRSPFFCSSVARRKTSAENPRARIFLRAAAARFVAQRFALPLLTGRFSRYPYKKNFCTKSYAKFYVGELDNMSLIEKIQQDLTAAMKEKDELRLSVLRMVKSALKNKEIEKMRPLENLEAMQVLQTLVKQRHESVEQFTRGGRDDLAAKEAAEIKIIENYLPPAPNDAEIARAIEDAIAETGADSPKQMGAVIKAARAKLEGKTVDGKVLSEKVRERLS